MEELTKSCCEKKVDNCNAKCYVGKKMNEENSESSKTQSPEMKLKVSEFQIPFSDITLTNTENNIFYSTCSQRILNAHISETEYPPKS